MGPLPLRTRILIARRLRRDATDVERLLWRALRERFPAIKFRRQHPIGPYIADFFVRDASLVIEIDGMSHDFGDHPQRDAVRDRYLEEQGYRVVRLVASDVMNGLDAVLTYIAAQVTSPLHQPSAGPPPRPGEEL